MQNRYLALGLAVIIALLPMLTTAQEGTIIDVISANPDFATLITAVQTAELDDSLNSEGPYTVFVPTNAAFDAALEDMGITKADILADIELLKGVLMYHVVPGTYRAVDLVDGLTLTTIQGQELSLHVGDDGVIVNTAEIVEADVQASNGVIHVINGVLLPVLELPEIEPEAVEGDIAISGSGTVYPLTLRMAELFERAGYDGSITVENISTGRGFEQLCVTAIIDIANASRAISEVERQACSDNGREALEFRVGTDALAVVVNSANNFIEDLSAEQLGMIFSGDATTWADVDPSFPADPIVRIAPATDSGTFAYFTEVVMQPYVESQGVAAAEIRDAATAAILEAEGTRFIEDGDEIIQAITTDPNAISFLNYAYYQANDDAMRILSVNGVQPTEFTAENGQYPLSRPLYIYSAASVLEEKPQVAQFISFYLTNVSEEIHEVKYFAASTAALNNAKIRLTEHMPAE